MGRPTTSLPAGGSAELALSIERAYRESRVLDRLGALWSLILAKCLLAQWAIQTYAIPVSGLAYVWSLSLTMAALASALSLRVNRMPLSMVPATMRVGGAVLLALAVASGFVLYAGTALGAFGPAVASGLCAALAGAWSLFRAAMRRAWEPLGGALLWWGLAGTALRSPDGDAMLWNGLGWLFASALPSFALSLRAGRRPPGQA
ncbi:MAG: hypothetical protein ACKORB_02435 [Opitutia bacterium]